MKKKCSNWKRLFLAKYFIIGLSAAFVLHISGSCSKDSSNPVTPSDNTDNVDVGKIDEGAKSVETAFLTGESQKVINLLTDDAKTLYSEDLAKVNKTELIKLGESLKTRQLDVYTDMYAEYKYTKDGIEYTIAFARKDETTWKLMRL